MNEQREFKPRPYQIALYEKSISENSIIYLPTGAGKTYIAVLVIVKLSDVLHKPYVAGGKRTIFAVNTVALVQQQTAFLARHTGLIVKGYSGDQQVDRWTEEEWLREITSSQVMVMTAQIFLHLLEHGIMPLSKVNLLIFDECHHAVKDHPMRQIMQRFENWPVNQHPRVLGLSASLLNANVTSSNFESTLKDLEVTFQSKIITVETLETVSVFSTKPRESIVHYDLLKEHNVMTGVFKFIAAANLQLKMLDDAYENKNYSKSSLKFRPESRNKKLAKIFYDINEHLKEMGLYGGLKSILLHMIQIDSLRRSSSDKNFVDLLDTLNTHLIKIQKLISDEISGVVSQDFLHNYASPKVSKLVEILKKFYYTQVRKNEFCCIIFVQRRFTAKVLYHILKELSLHDENFNFLKPDYILGQNNDSYKNARELLCLSKWNKETLLKFKNGIINCIVATDVVDEGIDIPSCTLVIRFYAPMDVRSYIQSKGRARHSTSQFVILVQHGDQPYLKRYSEFQERERDLQKFLHGRSTRQAPTPEEVDQTLYDCKIEPYEITRKNGQKSVLTEQNAISLINTYCLSLYSSKYSNATPIWIQEDVESSLGSQFRVHLTLPVMSPLKHTIKSDQCESISIAKRSAAFKACLELYKIGEFDDSLSPRSKSTVIDHAEFLFPHVQCNGTAAFTNSRRKYRLTYPNAWFAAYPKDNVILYLHVIEMIPNNLESSSEIQHSSFYNIFTNKKTYGILSAKTMPEVPVFPIFTSSGVFQINIKINSLVSPLTAAEINLLKQFHYLIFDEILALSKDFMIFDVDNQENSFLVVPVNDDQQIDWDVVKGNNHVSTIQPTKPFKVNTSDYEHNLILPTYRASSVYLVTEVCSHIKANSPFNTRAYDSYADYYKRKHNLVIENVEQPMLKVQPLSTEMNWLKPRIGKITSNYEELLVPELCKKITFPTVYWLKAVALPSILHRTSQLLVAEDLRVVIANQADLKLNRTLADRWDPLIVNENCEKSFNSKNEIPMDVSNTSSNDDIDSGIFNSDIEIDVVSLDKSLYSWAKDQEPVDLERNAGTLKPTDLDYYHKFMSQGTFKDKENLKRLNSIKCNYCFSKNEQEPPLQMLTKTNAHGPSPVDILQSLTAKQSNDVLDYERLETLGDAFLKYAISLYLYQTFPNYRESLLTELKGRMVSNSNLFCCGRIKNLAGKINVEEFKPTENFKVPAFGVDQILKKLLINTEIPASVLHDVKIAQEERFSGIMSKDTLKISKEHLLVKATEAKRKTGTEGFLGLQVVSEKCISDCVEAIIGIYLVRSGVADALRIMKWFGILPKMACVEERLMYSAIQDPRRGNESVDLYMPWASVIEKRIGYTFRNRAFLLQAFTHQTFTSNRITDPYERLEFLGDAILDFLLTVYIYEACGNLNPGELTDLRSALVNNITFACLCVRYGLHTALLAYAPELFGAIDQFVQFQEDRQYGIHDEHLWVLLEEDDCNMSEHVDVPKVLGDLFESVVGAVYLDSAKNLQVTWKLVYNLMKKEIETFSKNVPKQPIRVIHETIKANPIFSAAQLVEGSTTVMVTLSISDGENRKYFHGFGASKKSAKCAASKQALKYLRHKT